MIPGLLSGLTEVALELEGAGLYWAREALGNAAFEAAENEGRAVPAARLMETDSEIAG